ncbi:MAG TPA: thiamine pyrophosphate-binding protein [Noviherbaspirillum sp.]
MRTTVSLARAGEEFEPKAEMQVAELLVAYLEQLGVEYVFGVPGGAIEPIYNALARSSRRGGPRPVVARHEAGAAFMADGYTRETGKLGVCCATSGPGATNLITGVACAYDNSIPMLVLTGQPALPAFGRRALQESSCTGIDTLGMFRHCTRYNSLVSHPEQLEPKLTAALMRATRTPRGPVHLSIPLDILKSASTVALPSHDLRNLLQSPHLIDEQAVQLLVDLVMTANNIVLLVGGGCGEASAAILQFAALKKCSVVTTPDGKGLVSPRHPLFKGVFGFAGHVSADAALRDEAVDLILAVGTSMGEWTSSGWSDSLLNRRLVHIDESDDHLARSPMAKLHVRGRILTVFERLTERIRTLQTDTDTNIGSLAATPLQVETNNEPELEIGAIEKQNSDATPIKPQRLMRDLGRLFPPSTRFLADSGNSVAWAIHYLRPQDRRMGERRTGGERKITPGRRKTDGGWLRVVMDFAPMGWAIGGAVGTAIGCPDVPVVCISGDGSVLMNGQEISTAVAEGLTVIYVVLNDSSLGMVKHGQRLAGAERIAFELPRTDFAAMARALGAEAYTVRSPEELGALDIDAICSRKGPTLLDVYIDGDEVPPMNLRMQILGTAR